MANRGRAERAETAPPDWRLMKNITVSLPDEIYLEARVWAARRGTSVSALVRQFLESLDDSPSPALDFPEGGLDDPGERSYPHPPLFTVNL